MLESKSVLNRWTKIYSVLLFIIAAGITTFPGCDLLDPKEDDEPDMLYVKFINDAESDYTITTILLQEMGKAGETAQPSGEWSGNILTDGKTIAPGAHEFFNIELENLHWCQYRLGVADGQGGEFMLHLQEGYTESELPITHWGSDDRTVSVRIVHHEESGMAIVSGWSDWAGID